MIHKQFPDDMLKKAYGEWVKVLKKKNLRNPDGQSRMWK
jgi:hypothetical protein